MQKTAALRAAVISLSAKNLTGVSRRPPARRRLNNVRSVTGIDAKLGIPLYTSILRPYITFWKNFSKPF